MLCFVWVSIICHFACHIHVLGNSGVTYWGQVGYRGMCEWLIDKEGESGALGGKALLDTCFVWVDWGVWMVPIPLSPAFPGSVLECGSAPHAPLDPWCFRCCSVLLSCSRSRATGFGHSLLPLGELATW